MITKVFSICDAYEAGFGKGQDLSKDGNPYDPLSDEWEAWAIGYHKARDRKSYQLSQIKAAEGHHSDKGYSLGNQKDYERAVIKRNDPCPGCAPGYVCRTPACGRLKLPLDHPLRTVSFWKEK